MWMSNANVNSEWYMKKKYGIIMSHSTDSAIKTGIDAILEKRGYYGSPHSTTSCLQQNATVTAKSTWHILAKRVDARQKKECPQFYWVRRTRSEIERDCHCKECKMRLLRRNGVTVRQRLTSTDDAVDGDVDVPRPAKRAPAAHSCMYRSGEKSMLYNC